MNREQIELLLDINKKAQEEKKDIKKDIRKAENQTIYSLLQAQQSPEFKPSSMFAKSEEKLNSLSAFQGLNLESGEGLSQMQRNNLMLVSFIQDALNMKAQGQIAMKPESLLLSLGGQK